MKLKKRIINKFGSIHKNIKDDSAIINHFFKKIKKEVLKLIPNKRLVSGIKPTGDLTLGNYIGVLKPFLYLQQNLKNFDFYLFIADLHALTFYQEPQTLKQQIKKIAALYLAAGINPEKIKSEAKRS